MTQAPPEAPPEVPPEAARGLPILRAIRLVLLNVSFWIVAPLVTLAFGIFALPYVLAFELVVRDRRRTLRLLRRTISHYGAAILRCGWPFVRVIYVDHAPGEAPPFVFVANHPSSSDAFLMAVLPFECVQVLNIWPSRVPVVRQLSALAGYLRVREMPFDSFMAAGSRLLHDGVSIIAFPEGTRSGSRKMGSFHGSALRVAQNNRVKIVPLAISGNEDIPRCGSFILHPGHITVAKLPAVTCEQYEGMSPFKLKTRVREIIKEYLDAQPV